MEPAKGRIVVVLPNIHAGQRRFGIFIFPREYFLYIFKIIFSKFIKNQIKFTAYTVI